MERGEVKTRRFSRPQCDLRGLVGGVRLYRGKLPRDQPGETALGRGPSYNYSTDTDSEWNCGDCIAHRYD